MKLKSNELKNLIRGKGLTQQQAADKLGISRQTLDKKLNAPTTEFTQLVISKLRLGQNVNTPTPPELSASVSKNSGSGIPIYDLHVSAGNIEMYADTGSLPAYHVTVPGYEDCKFGMFVYGHSMYPTIENGSLVLCKQINDKSIIMYGEIYVITTGDYRMVKRIRYAKRKGYISCVSDNLEKHADEGAKYETFELAIDKVREIYLVKGIIKKTQS